jgi:3'-phosphoadenosine 5'-phosphosulfate sulfotransferase (PAPS reductase)/FAD synthetase
MKQKTKKPRLITDLEDRLKWSHEFKVEYAKEKIREWHDYYNGNIYVSFSGGKDSTVLLHLARSIYPDIKGCFCNTGLEFPAIVKFVQGMKNIKFLKPRKTFRAVINEYGYPVISKQIAEYVEQVRNNLHNPCSQVVRLRLIGLTKDNIFRQQFMISAKWQYLIDAPFKISARCCKYMKKYPSWDFEKQTGSKPIVGYMAAESQIRKYSYTFHGCNAYKAEHPRSAPLSVWTTDDIWRYIRENNVPYCDIYDNGFSQTGCAFCMFGIHKDGRPNRFELMKRYDPKIYKYCMEKLGIREVLDFLKIPTSPKLFSWRLDHNNSGKGKD